MTMNVITLLPDVSATSTSSSGFQRFTDSTPQTFGAAVLAQRQVELHPESRVSRRTGRASLKVQEREREVADVAYRQRMEVARGRLADGLAETEAPATLGRLRLQKGMSQSQLAQVVGTSQPHIAKIEAGLINPTWSTAVRIADALAVSLDDLRQYLRMPATKVEVTKLPGSI